MLQCTMCGLCCGPGVFTSEFVGENNSECAGLLVNKLNKRRAFSWKEELLCMGRIVHVCIYCTVQVVKHGI